MVVQAWAPKSNCIPILLLDTSGFVLESIALASVFLPFLLVVDLLVCLHHWVAAVSPNLSHLVGELLESVTSLLVMLLRDQSLAPPRQKGRDRHLMYLCKAKMIHPHLCRSLLKFLLGVRLRRSGHVWLELLRRLWASW